jgi:hypothetical protein
VENLLACAALAFVVEDQSDGFAKLLEGHRRCPFFFPAGLPSPGTRTR